MAKTTKTNSETLQGNSQVTTLLCYNKLTSQLGNLLLSLLKKQVNCQTCGTDRIIDK